MTVDTIKPVISLWIPISELDKFHKGIPIINWSSGSISEESKYNSDTPLLESNGKYVNVFVPYDYFMDLKKHKDELDKYTADLPF